MKGDGGFALVEALFAAALLAVVGTVIALVGTSLLTNQDEALRRSSALVTLDMMAKLLRAGVVPEALLPGEDENFRYELVQLDGAGPARLEARSRGRSAAPYMLDLMLPAERP